MFMFSDYECIITGQLGTFWVIGKNIKEIHNSTTSYQRELFLRKNVLVNHGECMLDFI